MSVDIQTHLISGLRAIQVDKSGEASVAEVQSIISVIKYTGFLGYKSGYTTISALGIFFLNYMLIGFCKLINKGIGHTKRITWMMPEGLLLFNLICFEKLKVWTNCPGMHLIL